MACISPAAMPDSLTIHYTSLAEDDSTSSQAREAAMLISVAEQCLYDEDGDQALQSATEALDKFKTLNDTKGVADSARTLNSAYILKGLQDKALENATTELETFKAAGNKRGEASMKLSMAEVQISQFKTAEALQTLAEASAQFQEAGDKKMEATTLLTKALTQVSTYSSAEALAASNEALSLFKEVGDAIGEGKSCLAAAAAHVLANSIDEGLAVARAALSKFEELDNKKMQANALNVIADMHMLNEKPRQAIESAKLASTISQEIKYAQGERISLITSVVALASRGDCAKAQKMAQEFLDRSVADGSKPGQMAAQSALKYAFIEKSEPEEALRAAEEELSLLKELDDKRKLANCLLITSFLQANREDGGAAVDTAEEAKALFQELNDRKGEGIAQYISIYANLAKEDNEAAVTAAGEAQTIFQAIGNKRWEADSLVALGLCKCVSEEFDAGIENATQGRTMFEEAGDKKGAAAAMLRIAELYIANKSFEDATSMAADALSILRELGHKVGQAAALHLQADASVLSGDLEEAVKFESEARSMCRKAEDKRGEAVLMQTIAQAHFEKFTKGLSDPRERMADKKNPAVKAHDKMMRDSIKNSFKAAKVALTLAKNTDNKELQGTALLLIARVHMVNGRDKEAIKAKDEALQHFSDIGEKHYELIAKTLGAEIALGMKKVDQALSQAEEAVGKARKMKDANAEQYAIDIINIISSMQAPMMVEDQSFDMVPMSAAGGEVAVAAELPGLDANQVREQVMGIAREVVGVDDALYSDSPLMEIGMDSLSAVQFRNILTRTMEGVSMPASLMFDYPSINQIVDFVVEESKKPR